MSTSLPRVRTEDRSFKEQEAKEFDLNSGINISTFKGRQLLSLYTSKYTQNML